MLILLLSVIAMLPAAAFAQTFDVVILNGRVMDPESNLDSVRNVGIKAGKIAAISSRPLRGKLEVDAKGLVVSPGFIDLNEHGYDPATLALIARDGVTTALELELGPLDGNIDNWYAAKSGKALVNFGTGVSYTLARMQSIEGRFDASGPAAHDPASPAQLETIRNTLEHGLQRGALGIGFGLQYIPGASRSEVLAFFRLAAKYGATCYVHLRYGSIQDPGSTLEALEEVIAASAISGASVHVLHAGTSALNRSAEILDAIRSAKSHGVNITADAYPYGAAEAGIATAIFDPGWQQRLGIDYQDLEWVATGERLTRQTFEQYRKASGPGAMIIHLIPEDILRPVITDPAIMIATDGGLPTGGTGHPRVAGAFARILGIYVREQRALPLMDALRKMTLLPAQQLEARASAMKNKGRLHIGADADITIFDPATVMDHATYEQPAAPSSGIQYVLVGGVLVVNNGQVIENTNPGKAVRAIVQ
jgi:N-acyl-D-aspartate/D-glutamate deacylase